MAKSKKEQRTEEEVIDRPKIETRGVWVAPKTVMPKSTLDFEWPEFKTDKERIKYMSKMCKGKSIIEMFRESGMDLHVTDETAEVANTTPTELYVGQIIDVHIDSISPRGVAFDNTISKQTLVSTVNLYKYEKLRNNPPKESIKAKVVSVSKDRVQIDPLQPMFDEWMDGILKDTGSQRVVDIDHAQTVEVTNLRLGHGGYEGKAIIPSISEFVGGDYTVDAFIPGSQIVLNIENDFEKWVGKRVNTFVTTYTNKPGTIGQMSLICSRKDFLKHIGEINMVRLFGQWCDGTDMWNTFSTQLLQGVVTGIINSSKKCGVFVEIPDYQVTGMIVMKPEELVNYKPQDKILVKWSGFEESMYYDDALKQMRHNDPYKIEDGILRECNIKPVFTLA